MNKRKMIIPLIAAGLAILFSACAAKPMEVRYYARFAPDPDKVVQMSVESEYAKVMETYFSVYDYMDAGEKIVKFDDVAKAERVTELQHSINLYTTYLENNDMTLKMADKNIEYNQKKYKELKKKYGRRPSSSEKLELQLMLDQIELIKNSKKEVELNKKTNQQIYDANLKTMQELKNLPDYFVAPLGGYLLTLSLKLDAETGGFSIGSMIPAGDVLLEVDLKDLEALSEGQEVKAKLNGQWMDMIVYKISDKLLLKFTDITITEEIAVVNFLQPQFIELEY